MDRFKGIEELMNQDIKDESSLSPIMPPEVKLNEMYEYIQDLEGMDQNVYTDTAGKKTIGTGLNLDAPATKALVNEQIDVSRLLAGEKLTPEMDKNIFEQKLKELNDIYLTKKKQSFPSFNETLNQEKALMSLMYRSPNLVGPKMQSPLSKGDIKTAGKEMLLGNNPENIPGLQVRAIKEAETFLGKDEFNNLVENLSDDEKEKISTLINGIGNKFTKEQFIEQYPFLKQMVPNSRFKRLNK